MLEGLVPRMKSCKYKNIGIQEAAVKKFTKFIGKQLFRSLCLKAWSQTFSCELGEIISKSFNVEYFWTGVSLIEENLDEQQIRVGLRPEAVTRRCSVKSIILEILQISRETPVPDSLF